VDNNAAERLLLTKVETVQEMKAEIPILGGED
jgi:hypothetical protein